jgi:predicted MFS family arabinose efflux permease
MSSSKTSTPFSPYQKVVVALLAFLQFTIILDFMILSPLGALLMPTLKITPSQFGLVVSVYAFSAGAAGLLAAGFADRFDRKKLLLFFYSGFILGTLFCGLAPNYPLLLIARMVTGLFGGVVGSIAFAVITDLFAIEMRGRVMGIVQTSFAASQIMGIPIALFLSNHFGWHAPFFMIVLIGIIAGIIIQLYLKPIDTHLKQKNDQNPFHHLVQTLSTPRYLQAYATTALLSTGGFMLMPFGSAFTVHNLGIHLEKLPLIYMVTGVSSIIAGPMIGRASDTFGKFRIFLFGSIISIIMILIYTHLSIVPISFVIAVNIIMFVGISARMISSQALMSGIPDPSSRGSFMAVNSSIQQLSGGIASMLAGMIVVEGKNGILEHFDTLGYVIVGAILITVFMMYFIQDTISDSQKTIA